MLDDAKENEHFGEVAADASAAGTAEGLLPQEAADNLCYDEAIALEACATEPLDPEESECDAITEDLGVLKKIVEAGSGDFPPLNARCLGKVLVSLYQIVFCARLHRGKPLMRT